MRYPSARMIWIFLISANLSYLALFNTYVFVINASGHTGISPYWTYWFLMPMLFASASLLALAQFRKYIRLLIAAIVLNLFSILSAFLFDILGIFLEYEEWLRRGMP